MFWPAVSDAPAEVESPAAVVVALEAPAIEAPQAEPHSVAWSWMDSEASTPLADLAAYQVGHRAEFGDEVPRLCKAVTC